MWVHRTVATALLLLMGAPLIAAGLAALPSRCCLDRAVPGQAQQSEHCQWVTPLSCCDQVAVPRDSGVFSGDLPTPGLAARPFIPSVVSASWLGQRRDTNHLAHTTQLLRLSVVLQV